MHGPYPSRRPQAQRVGHGSRRRGATASRSATWPFALAALALVALGSGAAARAAGSRLPEPSVPTPPEPAAKPLAEQAGVVGGGELDWTVPPGNWAPAAGRAALAMSTAPARAARGVSAPAPPGALVLPAAVAPERQSRQLFAELTAYSASDEEGTADGITHSGALARSGTVAVDPAVIPLGSRLYIAGLPGVYRAEDTGGGIRGAHVDVFMESQAAALQFGRRSNVLVEIVN